MKDMKACNQVIDIMCVHVLAWNRWTPWRRCVRIAYKCGWTLAGIRLWWWAENDGLGILTEGIPNLLCIVWECMPLIIAKAWTISKISSMDLDDVKGLVNVIIACVIGGISVMVREEIMFTNLPFCNIVCFSSILQIILLCSRNKKGAILII